MAKNNFVVEVTFNEPNIEEFPQCALQSQRAQHPKLLLYKVPYFM